MQTSDLKECLDQGSDDNTMELDGRLTYSIWHVCVKRRFSLKLVGNYSYSTKGNGTAILCRLCINMAFAF
jgi:hypothetical protein